MKVSYIRDKNGKRIDLRSMSKDLKHFNVTQGACSDGDYIYIAFEQKENKEKGREHRIKIVKFTKDLELVKVSKALSLGHANDICVDGDTLYVTHSGNKRIIHQVSTKTLAKKKDISIKIPDKYKSKVKAFNGITKYGDGFALRGMGGDYILYLDKNFEFEKAEKFTKPFKNKVDAQGMTAQDSTIVRAFSRLQSKSNNYICKYNANGKMKGARIKLDMKGELESVFYIGRTLYGTSYRKKGSKDTKYLAYIFRIG